ncbi:MAG: acyl carrier protein [Magnetococcales bacterium]|nr:acyl carrier protein [Magnetococcales bacterium]
MMHSDHDARIFKVLAGVLGKSAAEVAQLAASQESAGGDAQFWDSLQHINIILGLEAEFRVQFELMVAIDLKTIPRIRAQLASMLG